MKADILIIGGGFAGQQACKALRGSGERILLIDPNPAATMLPALPDLAGGWVPVRLVQRPLREILPANVEHLSRPLDFAGLRELYRTAACVVVPLHDVANQSGVTVMLEAMACGAPVVVTATAGQREVTRGPLVRATGAWDAAATADRGPSLLIPEADDCGPSGLYVLPGDVRGLRRALEALLGDADLRERLGTEGRRTAARWFTTERYVANLGDVLAVHGETSGGARSEAA